MLPTTGKHPACFALAHFEASGMVSLYGFTKHRVPVSPEKVFRFLRKSRKWPGRKGSSSLLGLTNTPVPRALWTLGTPGCWHSGTSAWPSCRQRGVNRAHLPHAPSSYSGGFRWAPRCTWEGSEDAHGWWVLLNAEGTAGENEDAFDQGGDWAAPKRINTEPEGRALEGTGAS